jgi:hypothetical protein
MTKVMKLLDSNTGRMKCKVCGAGHSANLKEEGKFARGSWQCQNGCKIGRSVRGVQKVK